jgi:hypothetical protein
MRPDCWFQVPCRALCSGCDGFDDEVLLAPSSLPFHSAATFSIGEATAAAIRQVFEENGEFAAQVELRRHFPGPRDNENRRLCVWTIAS